MVFMIFIIIVYYFLARNLGSRDAHLTETRVVCGCRIL